MSWKRHDEEKFRLLRSRTVLRQFIYEGKKLSDFYKTSEVFCLLAFIR